VTRAVTPMSAPQPPRQDKAVEAAGAAYTAAVLQEAGILCSKCERCRRSEVVRTIQGPGCILRERRCRGCRQTFFTTERHS
jgi:MinD superfamily P-loop ATPase